MKKIYITTLLLLAGFALSYAQCGMIDVPLSKRIQSATAIFEGKVIDKVSFWNPQHGSIYTANTIEVYKVFKGAVSSTLVEIVSEGGIVGTEMEIVTPSLSLEIGEVGIFMSQPAPVLNSPNAIANDLKFETVANTQGFIKYDLYDHVATDVFNKYTNIQNQVYDAITNQVGTNYNTIKAFNIDEVNNSKDRSVAPVITSFSPTTITAGTKSVLTITGTGFGTSAGKVQFANADDGGTSFVITNATDIVSWSATQIKVNVISKAGTGKIKVVDAANATVTSTGTLTVTYAQLTAIDQNNIENRMRLINGNTTGGYTYKYNNSFTTNTAAMAAFDRAMDTWKCATGRNMIHSGSTSITCNIKDATNVVSFDVGCVLGGSLLGKTFTYYSACSSNSVWYWTLTEIDILFAAAAGGGVWNYGPAATSGGKYDFESTALHELGHATLEGHVINIPKLMHWTRNSNTDVRTLDASIDVACGNDVVTRSITTNNPCGLTAHTKLSCVSTGITEEGFDNNVTIYPNPFGNSATLHIPNVGDNASISLFDVLGKEVKQVTNIKEENIQITRDNLPDGIYFYQVRNNANTIATGKIILSNGN